MVDKLLVMVVLLVIGFVVISSVGMVLAGMPGFVEIQGEQAFVYPAADGTLVLALATDAGVTRVFNAPEHIQDGCYWTGAPADARGYGKVLWVWPECH